MSRSGLIIEAEQIAMMRKQDLVPDSVQRCIDFFSKLETTLMSGSDGEIYDELNELLGNRELHVIRTGDINDSEVYDLIYGDTGLIKERKTAGRNTTIKNSLTAWKAIVIAEIILESRKVLEGMMPPPESEDG